MDDEIDEFLFDREESESPNGGRGIWTTPNLDWQCVLESCRWLMGDAKMEGQE